MHTGVVTNQINKDGAVNIEETLNKQEGKYPMHS